MSSLEARMAASQSEASKLPVAQPCPMINRALPRESVRKFNSLGVILLPNPRGPSPLVVDVGIPFDWSRNGVKLKLNAFLIPYLSFLT